MKNRHSCVARPFAILAILISAQIFSTQANVLAQTKPSESDDSWQVIYVGDQRIGYSRTTTRTDKKDGKTVVISENETHMTIKRFGQELKMQINMRTEENKDGDMLRFVFEMKNPPAGTVQTIGTVQQDELILETVIAGKRKKTKMPWDRDVKAPAFQDRLLRNPPLKPGDKRKFKTFVPQFNKVTDVSIVAEDMRRVKLLDGTIREALKTKISQSILPTMIERAYIDENGETLKTEMPFLGSTMVTYSVSKEVALEAIAGNELDIAVNTLVRLEKPIRNAHEARKIVYQITVPELNPIDYLSKGETQSAKRVDDETVELTVTRLKPEPNARPVRGEAEYLAATQFLQIRDQKVVEHANRATAGETNPTRIALNMEKYVSKNLKAKNFSTALASAAEVARDLQGDCTEHAVLLAAMLRAKKIPSRVAVGMVYITTRAAFGGHMWTEAFLGGKWLPLDPTMGRGGIGPAHIKLAESSFADDGPAPVTTLLPLLDVLGKMKIEVISVE